jgi:hypothetical protein
MNNVRRETSLGPVVALNPHSEGNLLCSAVRWRLASKASPYGCSGRSGPEGEDIFHSIFPLKMPKFPTPARN